eukprot:CAMPEP_0172427156 /NCGR_PEP_ID=MMETSP1064-20121228/40826_1 /TAXON_ID=202472 /ORGANISM="Aulacoseira subarctica , Strain CCAP 1002/5" /LENGTH=247 /DNA_ID=CAMNT_0013171205 /DNA_START=234 /DNA_END=975 /DNA_ORIENTATION=-
MHQQWLVDAVATASKLSVTSISLPIDEKSEVNRFVGWAVASLLQKWKGRTSTENYTPAACVVDCILCMRVLHAEAVQDKTYISQYYSEYIRVRNQGGLALIAHEFFDWALKLLSTIRLSFTEETIKRMGNDCMKVAYEEVTNIMENEKINFHKTMRKCLELNKRKKTEEATIEMVRIKVSKKVFHARANVVFARYSANYVGRYANKDSGMALRQELKATCGTSKRKEREGDKITECSKKKKKAVTPT